MSSAAINWLLEGNNPAIKYRTQVELLKESADISESKAWIFDKLPERLQESWKLLDEYTDHTGKVLLKGTMTKSYLPKERVGKVSKWVTFYTLLADKHRTQ